MGGQLPQFDAAIEYWRVQLDKAGLNQLKTKSDSGHIIIQPILSGGEGSGSTLVYEEPNNDHNNNYISKYFLHLHLPTVKFKKPTIVVLMPSSRMHSMLFPIRI